MKKGFYILFGLIIFIFANTEINADSNKKKYDDEILTSERFQHLMRQAHPRPVYRKIKQKSPIPFILSNQVKLPLFLNVNTIDDEADEIYRMQNESSIAVNPTNPNNLIASAVDYRDNSSTWVYVSQDGGKTWENYNLGKPFVDWRSTNDPSVAFSYDGVGYLCYGAFPDNAGGDNAVYIARSFDDGNTWEAHIPVILHKGGQTLDSAFEDKYYIHVDNSPDSPYRGHIYIPWKRVTPRDSATHIVISKSPDRGITWTEPVGISHRVPGSSEDTTFGQSFPLATTGPEGEVYVVWNHGIVHGVGFVKSFDEGKTWTQPRIIHNYNIFGTTTLMQDNVYRHTVKGKVRAEAYPVIVCDITEGERRGTLYLCWAADNIPNIYFSKSTDEGETWSEPIIVHSTTENDQFWQWMSIDPTNGDLAIMYLDSRNDPENIMVEAYVSYSSDGGDTWIDRRVADIGGDLRLNPFLGNSFAGDYSGCAFYDGIIYPSWIDMRPAVENIRDSDVYTAIVSIKAPTPVENFKANTIAGDFSNILLNWDIPTTYSFGQAMPTNAFKYELKRDGEVIAILDGHIDEYLDTDLNTFQKYDYKIKVRTEKDSSLARNSSAYVGGAEIPKAPEIITYQGSDDLDVTLEIKIPAVRDDDVNPLTNLKGMNIYRFDELIETIDFTPSDTGIVFTFNDKPQFYGYYTYSAEIFDDFAEPNISNRSEFVKIYTGPNQVYIEENFSNSILPLFNYSGLWLLSEQHYFSSPYSISISDGNSYKPDQNDTLMLYPVEILNSLYISFMHAGIIANNDRAFVEYSTDKGVNWYELDNYNRTKYPEWSDGVFDANDWKFEEFVVKFDEKPEYVLVRFRFYSNQFIEDIGWFIDNVVVNGDFSTSVSDISKNEDIIVYPNPANEYLYLRLKGKELTDVNIAIYNIYGEEILSPDFIDLFTANEFKLNTSNYPSGSYIIELTMPSGNKIRNKFIVVH